VYMCVCVCVREREYVYLLCVDETGWVEGGGDTHLCVRVCVFACVCVCASHTTNTRTHTHAHTHTHTHTHGARTHTHSLFQWDSSTWAVKKKVAFLRLVLAEFFPRFPSQIWVGDSTFVTFFTWLIFRKVARSVPNNMHTHDCIWLI